MNLGAIPVNEEQIISDQFNLVQVNSTRQLVIPYQNTSGTPSAFLFGGVQYEMDSLSIISVNEELLSSDALAARGEHSLQFADSTLRGGSWKYLK